MDRKDFDHIEMITRILEFGKTHVDLFPKETLGGQTFAKLGAALTRVFEYASGQIASRNTVRTRTTAREAAHDALQAQLQRVSDTARAIAIDRPGLQSQFRMPVRTRDRALILGAKAFAEAATTIGSRMWD